MIAVTKWTIKQRKWSTFWWSVGVAALVILTLAVYPSIRNQTSQLDQSFNQLPQSAKALFTDTQDLFSPIGYMSSQLYYLMLPMILSILAIGLGSSLIAREENDGTLELLLSRPVSRGRLVWQKALAGFVILAFVTAVTLIVVLGMCKLINMDISLAAVAVSTVYSAALALLFGSIAFFVSSLGRWGRLASIGIATLIAILGYIISSLDQVVSWMRWPAKVFAFHYYHPGELLQGHYEWWPLVFFVAIAAALSFLSWTAFRRRDVAS